MQREATTLAQYDAAMDDLDRLPIIGTHQVGELVIAVSHKTWTVTDSHGNHWSAGARSGAAMRQGVRKAVDKWLAGKFQAIR
ncbi:MAG: hypothetical protein IPO60_09835 [Flavobacteriales bacterium]|nr:hypothetical protein [Flavobacteriales bacterium]MBK9598591.1 hypothetical protein [Flavobacteriales bacterium]HQY04148.1 hypothetical protein [Flavobacteriales bacterium]